MSKRPRVQRLSDWENARYSVVPPRAARDNRLSWTHGRLLIELGRVNSNHGWCEFSQKALAEVLGIARKTLNVAISDLVEWGYVEKRSQEETGSAFCQYRVVMDAPEEGEVLPDGSTPPEHDVLPARITRDTPEVSPVLPASSYTHIDQRSEIIPPNPPRGGSCEIETAFEEFWKAFPSGRKRAKGTALVTFRKIAKGQHPDGHKATPAEMVEAAKRYASTNPDPKYTPMPVTWLNQGRWMDDLPGGDTPASDGLLTISEKTHPKQFAAWLAEHKRRSERREPNKYSLMMQHRFTREKTWFPPYSTGAVAAGRPPARECDRSNHGGVAHA